MGIVEELQVIKPTFEYNSTGIDDVNTYGETYADPLS